jgi:glycosyltransferase involved in cell wall biosynthesis
MIEAAATSRTALMVAAHPPGRGSGTGLRGLVTLRALRACCDRVDVVALESPGEARWAEPGLHTIQRRPDPPLLGRIAALRYGSAYYSAERTVGLTEQLRELVRTGRLLERYDIVVAAHSLTARAAHDAVQARGRILDIDNVAAAERRRSARDPRASLGMRTFRRVAALALAREERARCELYDVVTLPSKLECERLGPVRVRVAVVPNTVDEAIPVRPSSTGARLLFMGGLDYEPNVDALEWIAREILPLAREQRPDVELTVLGRNPSAAMRRLCRDARIDLVDDAVDLEPYHHASRVMLAPLRLGGGTRFKILEALARGEAIVATPTAAEGLAVRDGRDIRLEESAPSIANACVSLLGDDGEADRLGAAARATWAEHYRPVVAVERLVSLIESLAPA